MYYYIFEPAKNNSEINKQEDIKAVLQKNQVAGEFVTLSLAEDPQDLAKIGLRRGYTTIVAVGSDSLINQIAASLINTKYALGVVPTTPKSPFLKMTNVKDYFEACQVLPARRIVKTDSVLINNQHSLITRAIIKTASNSEELIKVNFDNHFQTEVRLDKIIISNIGVSNKKSKIAACYQDSLLDIYIPAKSQVSRGGILSIFSRLKKEKGGQGSIFHPKIAQVSSPKKIGLVFDEKEISSNAPFEIKAVPKSLNLVIKRKKAKNLEKNQK
jgi:diacylglycerol kinase family enzyme